MILAAGKGTRLLPLTKNLPKCLMPLAGRPLIDWQLSWLKKHGVTECVINLHYLPEQVRAHCGDGASYGLHVEYSFEPELLGTAGAVKKVADFFNAAPFFVIYGDNFSQWDLGRLQACFDTRQKCSPVSFVGANTGQNGVGVGCASISFESHEDSKQFPHFQRAADSGRGALGVMAVHWREDVTQSGMVEMDSENRIVRPVEKPKSGEVTSHYVNAGFYYLDPKVLDFIPEGEFCDFAHHVFPKMLEAGERIYAVKMEDPIIGIDTMEAYNWANAFASKLILSSRTKSTRSTRSTKQTS